MNDMFSGIVCGKMAMQALLQFNSPALGHIFLSELKPLLGLLMVPPVLVAGVLNAVYEAGGLHEELLCGVSFGKAKQCIEEYSSARVWHRHPSLPTGCHAGNQGSFVVLRETAAEFASKLGWGYVCLSPDPDAELLSTFLPGTPFFFNMLGLLMVLPLYVMLLTCYIRAGGMKWYAGDAAYLHFTTQTLNSQRWLGTMVHPRQGRSVFAWRA